MEISEIRRLAEEMAEKYNPEGLAPFPFEKIVSDKGDLRIVQANDFPDDVSGAVGYFSERQVYAIFVNQNKPQTRQHFTIAHEIGHYCLHKDFIRDTIITDGDGVLDTTGFLFRPDTSPKTRLEIEANNFAASLIMPEILVKNAWEKLRDVEACAEIFSVSVVAMSIRLTKLGLVKEA